MKQVNVSIGFDAEEEQLAAIMDALFTAVSDETGQAPMLALEVDGEHRDPDEPTTGLLS